MMFLFNWVIFRFQSLTFSGVYVHFFNFQPGSSISKKLHATLPALENIGSIPIGSMGLGLEYLPSDFPLFMSR